MIPISARIISLCLSIANCKATDESSLWAEWWTYDGISGTSFWGLMNPDWILCSKGKHQSPIDIDPRYLLFDPNLKPLMVGPHRISGYLLNTGHDVTFELDDPGNNLVNVSYGPLSYLYRIRHIKVHFGNDDTHGSEHTIQGTSFPAEIQAVAYNVDLYDNFSRAINSPQGIVIIAAFAEVGTPINGEFAYIASQLSRVMLKGEKTRLDEISIRALLPKTNKYITYSGSLTQPGCHETVTWIIMNKPIYITKHHLSSLRKLKQGGYENPQMLIERNHRPTMPLNHRVVRTNIDFVSVNHPTLE